MNDVIVIGSRKSNLALVQSEWVAAELRAAHPGLEVRIEKMSTKGDRILDAPLAKIGDKGLFVKELETALLEGRIDLAVHSAKDMPTALPDGLAITAFTEREDVRDAFVGRVGRSDALHGPADLREGAVVGSSSLRRRSQLLALRPDLRLVDLRGNVETRIRKLDDEDLDGTILAAAGLSRLGRSEVVSFLFGFDQMLPAVGQGALAIETRDGDERLAALIAVMDHGSSSAAVRAERALMRRLEGGCQVPIAARGVVVDGDGRELTAEVVSVGCELRLDAFVGSLDGTQSVQASLAGPADAPEALGETLAERLRKAGADAILAEVRAQSGPPAT